MLQMQIQLKIIKSNDKSKQKAEYSFFFDIFDSQNLNAY